MGLEVKVAALLLPPALLWSTTTEGEVTPPATNDQGMPLVTLRVQSDKQSLMSVLTSEGKSLNAQDLISTTGARPHPEVAVAIDPRSRELIVTTHAAETSVTFVEFANLRTQIPPDSQASFLVNQGLQTVRITARADNAAPLLFQFPDGGHAKVSGVCTNRFDLFRDQSYTFCSNGQGELANADGLAQALSSHKAAFHGGPLVLVPNPPGSARFERLTPMVEVTLAGRSDRRLEVQVGQKPILLSANERTTLTLANGTVVEFFANAAAGSLDWAVRKGELLFAVEGFPGLKVSGLTDQSASMHWDQNGLLIQSLSSQGNLVVSLADRSIATVSPQGTRSFPMAGRPASATIDSVEGGAGSSAVAVFFELPGGANDPSRPAAMRIHDAARHDARQGLRNGQAVREHEPVTGAVPVKRGALLAPENRPDAIYAIAAYQLCPQGGRLMAPRIFQPPATGF